jgi:hypothetical protein
MNQRRLQQTLISGRYALPLSVALALVCWSISFTLSGQFSSWVSCAIGFLSYTIIGYLLILLNNTFALIHIRASVQTIIYFLLVGACPMIHRMMPEDVASAMYLLGLFVLLYSYQQAYASIQHFYAFLFLGIGSLLYPRLTYFTPLFWVGAYMFQSLSWKSFAAGCLGWLLPYWFLLAYAYLTDDLSLFTAPFGALTDFTPITQRGFVPWEMATLSFLLVLFVVSAAHGLTNNFQEKMRTQVYQQFFMLLTLFFFLYVLIQPIETTRILPFLLINISLLTGHFAVHTNTRASNRFVIGTLVVLLLLFIFNLWEIKN